MKLFNTLSREKEEFNPINEGEVKIYSCGPTVYNYPHIGNYRAYIFSDLLKRYLIYKGYDVKHVMNITDVDDKTIRDSQKEGISLKKFTERYTEAFYEDLKILNIINPEKFTLATEHIQEMIDMIKILIEKGIAYKGEDGSTYYNVRKFENYGKLARINLDELKQGASGRVTADEYTKEDAHDFALWKAYSEDDGEVFWETELGKGRPGWHIECSAMSTKHLGNTFDIHTGGTDLIFPHHQNEIAQSSGASGEDFVKYWLHNEWLVVEGKKMSKSEGSFFTLRDIIDKGYTGDQIRYLLMSTHYRQKLNFTFEGLDAMKNAITRLRDFMRSLEDAKGENNPKVDEILNNAKQKFEEAMDDDLDISPALAAIFDSVREINSIQISKEDAEKVKDQMLKFDNVLGVMGEEELEISEDIQKLVDEREEARKNKDYAKADQIRDTLLEKGIILEDKSDGVRWKRA